MGARESTLPMLLGIGIVGLVLVLAAIGLVVYQVRQREMHAAMEARAMADERMKAESEARAQAEARARDARAAASPQPSDDDERLRARVHELEGKLAQAEARIRELESGKVAPPVEVERPPATPTAGERLAKAKERFAKLTEAGMFAMGGSDFQELLKELKEMGEDGVTLLTSALLQGASAKERFMAAALLEGLADPLSAKALMQSARDETDMLVRRMSVHALAVARFAEGKETLLWSMGNDADWGVRVNAAYGLAKMGERRGVDEMVKWYESPDTEAQYKLAVLGGISDVGDPSSANLFRNILTTSQDMTALLLAIQGATNTKDASLVPDLQRVADTHSVQAVKEAAQKAIVALRGY